MAYTNAIFHLDYTTTGNGDAVRTTLTNVVFSNSSGTTVLGTKAAHGLVTGAVVTVSGCTQAYANTVWKITRVDNDTFTVDTALWASWTGADVTGDVVPFGGQDWNDPWKTMSLGATAARIAPGDIIKIAQSPVPTVKAAVNIVSSTDASPIAIHAHSHGLATGDQTTIAGHETNIAANGVWTVTVSGVDDFTLDASTGSGAGSGGATGTSTILGIGKGTWTDQPATLPVSISIVTSTNAGGLISIHAHNHGFVTGDCVYIQSHLVALTANGCWIITKLAGTDDFTLDGSVYVTDGAATGTATLVNRAVVKLVTAQTLDICKCQVIWNVANTSTITLDATVYKDGDASHKLVKASPANSTLYSWVATTGSLNLSTWNKLSFWIRNETVITANQWSVCLCSGADGTGVQNTFKISAIPSIGRWLPLTLSAEEGTNLYNGIQSIAIYSGSSAGTTTGIYFNNFIACTTNGLNLQSLISKNTTIQGSASSVGYANEGWYGIKNISVDGKVIFLDVDTNSLANANIILRGMGYSGTTESVSTYIRETIKTSLATSSSTTVQECLDSGIINKNIQYQGGYNVLTGSQTGETFFDGLTGFGRGIYLPARSYNILNYLCVIRYDSGVYFGSSSNNTLTTLTNANNNANSGVYFSFSSNNTLTTLTNANNNSSYGVYFSFSSNNTLTTLTNANNNYNYGVYFSSSSNNTLTTLTNANNNYNYGVYFSSSSNNTLTTLTNANNNSSYGVYFYSSSNNIVKLGNVINNVSAGITSTLGGINYLKNFSITGTEWANPNLNYLDPSIVYIENYNNSGYDKAFTSFATMISKASTLTNGSGKEWQIEVNNVAKTSINPFRHILARVYVAANAIVTTKLWMKKSHGTNIVARLAYMGGQITGLDSDVFSTDLTDTTETEVTLTLNQPTVAGVIEIEIQAYWGGATANVIFDKLTIQQS
jgi:hypothetical protein